MKIAVLIEWRYPIYGWGQTHVLHLSRNLIEKYGYSIDLFTRNIKIDQTQKITNPGDDTKMKVIRCGIKWWFFSIFHRITRLFSVTWKLYRETRISKYDLIHAHSLLPWLPAMIVSLLTGIPVVYTVHGTMHLDKGVKNIKYYIEYILVCIIKYDAIISVSKKLLIYKNNFSNLHIIFNWVNVKEYSSTDNLPKYAGAHFLFVGRVDRQKNLNWFVEILKECDIPLLKSSWFHWNIVGDGLLREELLSTVEKYWLSQFVTWKWPLFGEDLIKEYHANHVFVLPSLAEGQPITLLEAMASWLVILATEVGENKEFIEEGKEWFLVRVWDSKEFKNKFEYLLNNTNVIQRIWEHNKVEAQKYDRQSVVEKTISVYTWVLAR